MNAIENRALGRQALQAHPREPDAAPIQRVARYENGMEKRLFKILNDSDRCGHPAYTQNNPFSSGAPHAARGREEFIAYLNASSTDLGAT